MLANRPTISEDLDTKNPNGSSPSGLQFQRVSRYILPAILIVIWVLVRFGPVDQAPTQAASWLTFLALLIAPGYLLGDIITWRLDFEWPERLALAFPTGIAILAVPGMSALLQHQTVDELAYGWTVASAIVIGLWILNALIRRPLASKPSSWTLDQFIMIALIGGAFVTILPTLNLFKIDGDAFAVNSFAADALAGMPLNANEPLFGTDLGPGVRMAFNQSLPMFYLWSLLSGIDVITLTATASRAMIGLWILLATYTLAKTAASTWDGPTRGRRFGLFVVLIQLIVFIAAPFMRGDNISIFFFERTAADKFMVPLTMLPVLFAFALHFLHRGRGSSWLAAGLVCFAVSTIHPLIAAMAALGLGAFAGFRWLLNWRDRTALKRAAGVAALVAIVMAVPIIQLALSRGDEPLAASYPSDISGWNVGAKEVPVLPGIHLSALDVYGPLPDLSNMEAFEANTDDNPFLIWRFAVNMNRRRLVLFDLNSYISDPNLILEPPYLLGLLLLPILLWRLRSDIAAQFAVSVTLAVLFIMFNPIVTPALGSLVMPWILWRFVWLLPFPLIIGLAAYRAIHYLSRTAPLSELNKVAYAPLAIVMAFTLMSGPAMVGNIQNMQLRTTFPYYYPTPDRLFSYLQEQTVGSDPVTVLANQDLSVTIPAYVAKANVVAHRVPTTSEVFPANRQEEALQRLIDQDKFFRTRYLTDETIAILQRYDIGYIVTSSGSALDVQLRLADRWFSPILDDQSYSLYSIKELPVEDPTLAANHDLVSRRWEDAEESFRSILARDPGNALAMLGLAESARAQGQFHQAVWELRTALERNDHPALHYRLGQVYADMGSVERSLREFESAHKGAPNLASFSIAYGDACLSAGQIGCATRQFQIAIENQDFPDHIYRTIALGDIWRQRGDLNRAIGLYERAVNERPSQKNQLMLAAAYLEAERLSEAEDLLRQVRALHPLSIDAIALAANVQAAQGDVDDAVKMFNLALGIEKIQTKESTATRLLMAQTLMEVNEFERAQEQVSTILQSDPNNAAAYRLQGDLYLQQKQEEDAIAAFRTAFSLDPSQVGVYVALSTQLRRMGSRQDELLTLLEQARVANPGESMLALALGDHLERRGDTLKAIDTYQTALNMFDGYEQPGNEGLQANKISRAYAYARLARTSEDLGKMEPAMNYYRAAAAITTLPWPQAMLGDALRRRNDNKGAEAAYQRAVTVDPDYMEGYMRLADLHMAHGDSVQARLYREKALDVIVEQTDNQTASLGRVGLSKIVPGQARLGITYGSDETLAQADGSLEIEEETVDAVVDQLERHITDHEGGGSNIFRMLARLYETAGKADVASVLYERVIEDGENNGWNPVVLAEYHKGLGDLHLAQNLADEAAAEYRRAVELDAWWPQARLGLAQALLDLGETDEAIEQLRSAVDIAPGYVEAQVMLADTLQFLGATEEALSIYEKNALVHAGNIRATLALGNALVERGQYNRAETVLKNTIQVSPGAADAFVGLAMLYMEQGLYDEAEAQLNTAMELDQRNVNAYIRMGTLAQIRGNSEEAIGWFRRAADLQIGGQLASITLIDLLQQSGHYDEALAFTLARLDREPDNGELHLRLAEIQRARGEFSHALEILLQSADLDVQSGRLSAELADLYSALGRPRDAITAYEIAIEKEPEEATYYLRLSELWRSQGRIDTALRLLIDAGLNQAADTGPIYAAIAEIDILLGLPEAARVLLEKGQDQIGSSSDIVVAMGEYHATRSSEAAELWYTTALEEHPMDAGLYIALGDLYASEDRTTDAIESYKKALALEPDNATLFVVLGNAYQLAGAIDEAEAAFREALEREPTLIDAYANLATIYQDRLEWDKAEEIYRQGMAAAPTNGPFVVQYGTYLLARDRESEALEVMADALEFSPTTRTLVARAAVYSALERYEEAQQDLEIAYGQAPGSVDVIMAMGFLYRDMDDAARAQEKFDEADALVPGIAIDRIRLSGRSR